MQMDKCKRNVPHNGSIPAFIKRGLFCSDSFCFVLNIDQIRENVIGCGSVVHTP